MLLSVHLEKLVRAIAPGVLICIVHTVIEDLFVEVIKVFVTLCTDVGRLEGLLVHWQPLNPLFRVDIVNLGLLVD